MLAESSFVLLAKHIYLLINTTAWTIARAQCASRKYAGKEAIFVALQEASPYSEDLNEGFAILDLRIEDAKTAT